MKRWFDITLSLIALIMLFPLLALISISIKLSSKGPIIFCQERIGRYKKPFTIHKFRTMYIKKRGNHELKITIGKDTRITKAGKVLRKFKLDELPQLFDVLIGNMSLVGPRPEVAEYIRYYPQAMAKIIFSVRPGITDWASIKMIDENIILANSQNPELTYVEQIIPTKLDYAIKYINNQSMLEDLKIIIATIVKIFTR